MEESDIIARLKQKIASYRPSATTIELVRDTPFLMLVGISGAGKNSIKDGLLRRGSRYHFIVSHTTRQPRKNNGVMERDGVEYYFITLERAERMLDEDAFVEAKLVDGRVYGTSVAEIQKTHDAKKIAVADIEVRGVAEYVALDPTKKAIFILPPSYETWQDRLHKRHGGAIDRTDFERRMQRAVVELEHALRTPYFHFVINDSLEQVVDEIDAVATGTETRGESAHARSVAQAICNRLKATSGVVTT